MNIGLKENDLISFMNPICPRCHSRNIVNNGRAFRTQRYICEDCRYSFVARPPNYGYGKHYPDVIMEKSVRARVKTSLRKAADLLRILGNVIISQETTRRYISPPPDMVMASS